MKLIRLLKHELAGDAKTWVEKQLITREQADQILDLYGASYPTEDRRSIGYFILLSFAALFVGLAIIIFVGHNWQDIPRAIRMGGLISLTLAFQLTSLFYHRKENPAAATLWSFLGCLSYGASIFLIAQIYHLGEYFPDGIFYWAAGVLPFALIFQSTLLILLVAVLANLWMFVEQGLGVFPYLMPFFIVPMFHHCFKNKTSVITFLFAMASALTFFEFIVSRLARHNYGGLDIGIVHVVFTTAAFILCDVIGKWMLYENHTPRLKEYGLALRIWSLRAAAVALIIMSFELPWREFFRGVPKEIHLLSGICAFTVGSLVALLLAQAKLLQERIEKIVLNNLSALAYLGLLIIALVAGGFNSETHKANAALMQIITNIFLLGTGARLIIRGFEEHASSSYYFGVSLILLTAFLRYIDLIGNYIGGSIMFMFAGVAMYVAARFWRYHAEKELEVE